MNLLKTEHSCSKGIIKLDKVLLKYDDTNYYELVNYLSKSSKYNYEGELLKSIYDSNTNIVLKFGYEDDVKKEYEIIEILNTIPNFIRFFCFIVMNDDIKNIINNNNTIPNYKMNYYGSKQVGIIVMPYYEFGCIENYNWIETNFDILKNLIKQVIFASIYLYETTGFIHKELHSGNILVKPKSTNTIKYDKKILILNELEAVIMDFNINLKSNQTNQPNQPNEVKKKEYLIKNIYKFISSIEYGKNMDKLNFEYDFRKFSYDINLYDEFENIINEMKIYYLD
jgi:hypothetical protein